MPEDTQKSVRIGALAGLGGGVAAIVALAWVLLGSDDGEPRAPAVVPRPPETPAEEHREESELAAAEAPATIAPAPEPEPDGVERTSRIFTAEIFGRVIALPDEEPAADLRVRVWSPSPDGPDEAKMEARTDEEGRFRMKFTGPMEARAAPQPKRGWVPADSPVELTVEQRRGEEEVVLKIEPGPSATVRGQVVDEKTREPVHEVQVEIASDFEGVQELVITDAEGFFATETAFPQGHLFATVIDVVFGEAVRLGSDSRPHLEDGSLARMWELPVRIGPTYFLLPTGGGTFPTGDWVAEMVEEPPGHRYAAKLQVGRQLVLLPRSERQERLWSQTPLRTGKPPWVRWPRQEHEPDEKREVRLSVLHGSHEWWGEARVDRTTGRYRDVVGIPLEPIGALTGKVVTRNGGGIDGLSIGLSPRTRFGDPASDLATRETVTAGGGLFVFERVPTRLFLLALDPQRYPEVHELIDVPRGVSELPAYVVSDPAPTGSVTGRFEVKRGHRPGEALVTLRSMEGLHHERIELVRYGRTFRFDRVPRGEYQLIVEQKGRPDRQANAFWTPRRTVVYPPEAGIRIVSQKAADPVRHVFDGYERRSNLALDRMVVIFGPEGGLWDTKSLGQRGSVKISPDLPFRFALSAPGYQPTFGDESNFLGAGNERVARIPLDPGWGATIHLREGSRGTSGRIKRELRALGYRTGAGGNYFTNRRITTGAVYADGEYVTRFDGHGRARLSLLRKPERIQIVCPGWIGSSASPLHDWYPADYQEVIVWMVSAED
ncbi:MAG: hypothetical protein O7B99_16170 [Planctomycetota bacterium]|nr:hypothetical protein [Planctomycetota bacterium]